MKCLGRQTRPTYSPERRALHLFGNRFPLRLEYRPVLSCAWYYHTVLMTVDAFVARISGVTKN
jgi:hypothetical protein